MAGQSWVKFQRNKLSSETVIKKTRLQFCISSLHMNRKLVSHGTFEVLFISEPKRKIVALLFLLTLLKFQTPLTLSSHNSGSKNCSNKNHHSFKKPWTSAFRWHTLDTSQNCLHWSNWPKCEKNPFFSHFPCPLREIM